MLTKQLECDPRVISIKRNRWFCKKKTGLEAMEKTSAMSSRGSVYATQQINPLSFQGTRTDVSNKVLLNKLRKKIIDWNNSAEPKLYRV